MPRREDVLVQPRTSHRRQYWRKHDREEYECPGCGKGHDEVEWFEVHHIDGDYRNGKIENLIALCHHCHWRWHRWGSINRRLSEMKNELRKLGSPRRENLS